MTTPEMITPNTPRGGEDDRLLSQDICQRIVDQIAGYTSGDGKTYISISAWWSGELRWARNRVSVASDRRNIEIGVTRQLDRGARGSVFTNQLDEVSLRSAVQAAERGSQMTRIVAPRDFSVSDPEFVRPKTMIWSDTTYGLSADKRAEAMRLLAAPAVDAQMMSAGYIQVAANGRAVMDTEGRELRATWICVADELASAAELVTGKINKVPVALIRGYTVPQGEGSARDMVRQAELDMFL